MFDTNPTWVTVLCFAAPLRTNSTYASSTSCQIRCSPLFSQDGPSLTTHLLWGILETSKLPGATMAIVAATCAYFSQAIDPWHPTCLAWLHRQCRRTRPLLCSSSPSSHHPVPQFLSCYRLRFDQTTCSAMFASGRLPVWQHRLTAWVSWFQWCLLEMQLLYPSHHLALIACFKGHVARLALWLGWTLIEPFSYRYLLVLDQESRQPNFHQRVLWSCLILGPTAESCALHYADTAN